MLYFAFAIADSMFPALCTVVRTPLNDIATGNILRLSKDVVYALNPSHKPTIDAAIERFGLPIQIPEKAPIVTLKKGDKIIVMSVRGLPRMEGRHEYTTEEIANATFAFAIWVVNNDGGPAVS